MISASYSVTNFSSYFFLSNILRFSRCKSSKASGILSILSSSVILNFLLRFFSFSSYFFIISDLFLAASCLNFFTMFLVFLLFFPKVSSRVFLILYLTFSSLQFTFFSSIIFSSMHSFTIFHSGLLLPFSLRSPVTVARYLLSNSKQKFSTSGKPISMCPSSTRRWSRASLSPNFLQISQATLKSGPPMVGSISL